MLLVCELTGKIRARGSIWPFQVVAPRNIEHLRHCSFAAMRDDEKPMEVVRETDGRWFDGSRVR